jgi:fructose-1,6-bisphosphatase I
MTTLEQHLDAELRRGSEFDPAIGAILGSVARAARALAREVRGAAIAGHTGLAGDRNVTGDAQKKLDVIGNNIVLEAVAGTRLIAAVVSEELGEAERLGDGDYVLCTDPLDGSSNTDINGTVGTIFGLYRRPGGGPIDPTRDLLRSGREQILAGYVMYGPSTLLVYTAGRGTHGFTLDLDRDEFVLTHANIRCLARGTCLSANLARLRDWHPGVQRFVASVTGPDGGARPSWSLRYTGALVADVHRSLIEGGIYFYPADPGHPDGKLRLLYECAPLAFVVEQAGGAASTGAQRMLDVRATKIHQRVPLVIGSAEDVALFETFGAGRAPDA